MAKRRSARFIDKIKTESDFEVINVNEFLGSQQTVEVSESGISDSPEEQKPKTFIYRRSRATQVYAEDLDQLVTHSKIPSVPGENEAIQFTGIETNIPQCRFCLRRVSPTNLKVILTKHKPKAMAAYKIKIFPSDAYPLACCNCLNLLDIFLDFKDSVLKARHLLLSKRVYLESDGWDDPVVLEAFAQCKATVEQHKKQIDQIFEEYSGISTNLPVEKSEISEKNETVDDVINSYASDEHTGDQLPNNEVIIKQSPPNSPCVLKQSPRHSPVIVEQSAGNSDEEDGDGDVDELDPSFVPSSSEDKEFQKVVTKKKRGRQRKIKQQDELTNTKNPQLCDLCGERVCPQSAEGHRNRHLGIKPYNCPVIGCDLTFYSRANATKHVKRIHGEKGVQTHECNICGKFIRGPPWQLKYHKRSHEKEEKNCICQICGKGFTRPRYLRQHSMVHSGEFPHKCSYCGKKFNNKWSMKTHEKNMHEKKNHAISTTENPVEDDQTAGVSNFENTFYLE